MIVGILTAADGKIGGGHLVRMQEVQKIFTANGILCQIFSKSNELIDYLKFNNKERLVAIIDLPPDYNINLKELQAFDKCLKVGYELSGHITPDYNIVPFQFKNRNFKAKHGIVSGLQYLIIRSKIRSVKGDKNYDPNSLLISLGGGDTYSNAVKVYKNISKFNKEFKASIVIGPQGKKWFNLRKNVISSPENFPQLLNSSNFVITNGGTTLIESLYLGKSVYCFPQNKDEKEFSFFLSNYYRFKIIEDQGKSIKLNLEPKMNDFENSSAIDGLGGDRVVNFICSLLIEKEAI